MMPAFALFDLSTPLPSLGEPETDLEIVARVASSSNPAHLNKDEQKQAIASNSSRNSKSSRGSYPDTRISPRPQPVVTPELLRRWRVSRPWLKAREPELLACGWNKGKLYRIRPPFGRSYHWGVAWGWGWTLPNTVVRISEGGAVEFHVTQPDGRVNIMAAQPR